MTAESGTGDEVIVQAYTFCATAIPFGETGAQIIWADIDPETWTVDPWDIEEKTRADKSHRGGAHPGHAGGHASCHENYQKVRAAGHCGFFGESGDFTPEG